LTNLISIPKFGNSTIEVQQWIRKPKVKTGSFAALRISPAGLGRPQSGSTEILHCVQDFACGLGRPQSGSTC
jgi:hypothetical protein